MASDGVLMRGLVVPQRMRFRIIDGEASGIGRDIQQSVTSIGHVVDMITDQRHMCLIPARQRVVRIQCFICAYPVLSALIAVDVFC